MLSGISLTLMTWSFIFAYVHVLLHLHVIGALENKSNHQERVILVYPIDGCRGTRSESANQHSSGLELQSPRRARDIALAELTRRVNRARGDRLEFLGRRRLDEGDAKSIKLNTRYLNALQIEIAHVPEFMSEDDMIDLSVNLPCVQMVSRDYVKKISEPLDERADFNENKRVLAESHSLESSHRKFPKYRSADQIKNHQGSSFAEGEFFSNKDDENSVSPNDNLFKEQWHLQHSQYWGIGAQRVWSDWRGSPSMVVAIIDSGCDLNHPDLVPRLWTNAGEICGDGIDNDKNGYVDDCNGWDWVDNDNTPSPQGSGHGTAAAGIISASSNNYIGVAGICWECTIMCLRFIQGIEGRVSNQVAAIDYAAKMGAKISNNSYGGYGLEYEVIKRARAYGHLFVSSAGNNNYDTDLPQYDHTPSIYNFDNILAVGASTMSGKKASFSNYGKKSVDLFAPGSRIVTTENGGGYSVVSGTSFAAPMGAGSAALLWSRYPSLGHTEVINALITSCKASESLNGLALCGGVIDLPAAMNAAARMVKNRASGDESSLTFPSYFSSSTASPDIHRVPITTAENLPELTPIATPGYTGWLGAFLSGFGRAFGRQSSSLSVTDDSVAIESPILKKAIEHPYLLFKGSDIGGESVTIDPMYLKADTFDKIVKPYEKALGLSGASTVEEAPRETSSSSIKNLAPDIKSSGLEKLIASLTLPTLNQLQWMSSTIKNIVWDKRKI